MQSACLYVCPLASQKRHVQTVHVTLVVARFSAVDIAIRYVLPVLWMTSCFHIMEQMSIQACGLRRSELFTLFARWRRYIAHAVAKSALLDCLVPFWRRIRLFCGLSLHSLTAACVADSGACLAACECNVYGSVREDCDQTTGRCVCKRHVTGLKCDRCVVGTGRRLRPFGCSSK